MEFEGKVAIITGGSRGIGRAVARKLALGGGSIVFSYASNTDAAQKTLAELQGLGAPCVSVQGDVADAAAVNALVNTAMNSFGRIDILVNCAGITRDQLLLRMKDEEFDQVIATNLRGTYLCMKAVCRTMLRQRYGRIISLSSIVGLHGNAGQVNYAASKAGIIGMTKSLARELASRGITVNAVAPGCIDTDMTAALPESVRSSILAAIPMARLGQAEDVANLIAFLASDEAAYLTGQVISVDGGMSI